MSVLLTGGAGFIGSHTAVELLDAGEEIILADNFSNSSRAVISRIQSITKKTPRFYHIDVADRAALRRVFEENQITAVIHFAGYKAVGESVQNPIAYYRNNLDTTLSLLEVMHEYRVKQFIFSSSATVYGSSNTAPFTEDMPTGG
ncbi:MAG: SDR family NAD(P)-dependent oxidoreductase, partial [Oscillospiraceae bacterium]